MEFSLSNDALRDIILQEYMCIFNANRGEYYVLNRISQLRTNFKKSIKEGFAPDSMHHMIYALLRGKDVFKHFLPKDEAGFLKAVLAEDPTSNGPYHALFQCTSMYMSMVSVHPDLRMRVNGLSPDMYKLVFAGYHTARCILPMFEPFGFNAHEVIRIAYNLRPHVEELHKEIFKIHGNNQINYQG